MTNDEWEEGFQGGKNKERKVLRHKVRSDERNKMNRSRCSSLTRVTIELTHQEYLLNNFIRI
jgi:hypothetical protein